MNTNKNFHASINDSIIEKIEQFAELASGKQLFLNDLRVDLIDDEVRKDYLEHQHRSGYLSYNRGGIELSLYLDSGFSSGIHLTKKQAAFVERMQSQCLHDFRFDNNIDESVDIFEDDAICKKFYEYESEYFSDIDLSLLQFRIAIDDNADLITIDLSICYNDSYFRSSSFELIAALDLNFKQFERIEFKTLERYFKRALKRA